MRSMRSLLDASRNDIRSSLSFFDILLQCLELYPISLSLHGRGNGRYKYVTYLVPQMCIHGVRHVGLLTFPPRTWARCLHCREEANKARCRAGLLAFHMKSYTDSQRECNDDESVQCSKCGKCRPYDFYPASAIKNRARNKDVVCNVCQKLTRCDRCYRSDQM